MMFKGVNKMWVLSWKKYALSKFATFVSVLGALMRYAGVMCLFSGLIPAALIYRSPFPRAPWRETAPPVIGK